MSCHSIPVLIKKILSKIYVQSTYSDLYPRGFGGHLYDDADNEDGRPDTHGVLPADAICNRSHRKSTGQGANRELVDISEIDIETLRID